MTDRFLATLRRTEVLCRDGDTVLWRAQAEDAGAALVRVAADEVPSVRVAARLAHEFGLRGCLDSDWAVRPQLLAGQGGRAELVLEDPGGIVLDALLRHHSKSRSGEKGLAVEGFLVLALRMAEALAKLHAAGLVHKGIKPGAMLVAPDGDSIRFTSFGFASVLPRHQMPPEPIESIEGDLAYMAPEQTGRMNRSVDCRSDLYSLGIVFFEMLAGRLPFDSNDPAELVHFHVARRPPPLSRFREDVPVVVLEMVAKLLSKAAEDRYQTAKGLAADLRICLEDWRGTGAIAPFLLGANDRPDRLVIPEKLYGREAELRQLLDAAGRVTGDGALEVVFVAGYSGIGKSVLVGELQKALVGSNTFFATGKFDQYKRHIPYATWAQAFQGCVRQILGLDDARLVKWRLAILDAVGQNGRLITDLIPDLALLIGEQPLVPELPPNEAQHRFFTTFRRFLARWATERHPLVLFLDDLQWIDPGSLKLLEYLAGRSELGHLLLVCAYRDNEVGPAHPLTLAKDAIRARTRIEEIPLRPLSTGHLRQLVAETLSCPAARAQPLVEIIGGKTGGNPFFTIQFMHGLFEEQLLSPGPEGWQWDMERIAAKNFTDNVVDLMVGKILRLPEKTQEVMRRLACLGNMVPVRKLALVHDGAAETLDADLGDALRASYLVRRNDTIHFSHDRIQEAAYSLLPAGDRPAEHLRIARKLAAGLDPAGFDDAIFEIVGHFTQGVELVSDPEERYRLGRWCALAGEKAKASAAYVTAQTFFVQAMDLLPPDAWDHDYDRTLWLYLERVTCELLLGNFQQVDDLLPFVLERTRGNADRARAYRLLILRNQVAGRYGDAVDIALNVLGLFGLDCPASPAEVDQAVAQGRREASANLRGREIGALIDAPAMTDPEALAMIGILADCLPCSFLARPDLYGWLALNGLNITLRQGNTGDSCSIYMGYAIVLVSEFGEIDESLQYADLALKLQETLSRPDLKGRILVRSGVFINSRRNSFESSIEILREGFVECQAAGDYSYAVYGALEMCWLTLESGAHLDELDAASVTYSAFAEQSRNIGLLNALRAQKAFVSSLTGALDPTGYLENGAEFLAALTGAKFGTGVAYFHLMGQMVALLRGEYLQARDQSLKVAASLKSITGWVAETTYHLLAVLTLSQLDLPVEERRQEMLGHVDLLRRRAGDSPRNYGCRYSLALAELARLDGDVLEAQRRYEEAIASARDGGFLHLEAMAYESASRFYREREMALIAETYLRKARDCYAQWGAVDKVRRIESEQPELGAEHIQSAKGSESPAQAQNLDVISVVKASQAVSGEIALDRLVETLLRITVENAGAQRGALIVDLNGTPTVVAQARIGDGAVSVESQRRVPNGADLPEKVLNYVHRAWKRVLLDDALQDNDFSSDPYLRAGKVRSVLCLPMVKQSRLIGLLYLENSHVSHVFTADRVAVLDLLASQAAISLENALLYEDLQRHRDDLERTVAERTAQLVEKKEQLDKILNEQEIILENASLGIVVVKLTADGRRVIQRANIAAGRLLGYAPGALEGMETRAVWTSEEDFRLVGEAYKLMAEGQTYSGEHAIRRRNGERGVCKLVGAAADPSDLSKGTIWLIEDITDRRAADAALRAAKDLAEEMAAAFRDKSEQVASLLDNSGQGFLSFGANLVVDSQYSRACETMLGQSPAGKDVASLLFPDEAAKADLLRLGVPEALKEREPFKRELYLSLLPTEVRLRDLILAIEYSVLESGHLMLVLTDITEERRLEDRVRSNHKILQMVVTAVTDSRDFFDSVNAFRRFTQAEIPALAHSPLPPSGVLEGLYREVHTFKGTLNQFSFQYTPEALHCLEGRLGEMRARKDGLSADDIRAAVAAVPLEPPFERDLSQLREIIGDDFLDRGERITLTAEQVVQLERLASDLLRGEAIDTAVPEIRRLLVEIGFLRKTPLCDTLSGHRNTVAQVAARLEKNVAPVEISGGEDIWIDPKTFAPFLRSLAHVFRNAVTHGIEDPDSRLLAGKNESGRITCKVGRTADSIHLSIADDGVGIDQGAVRTRVVEAGLMPAEAVAAMTEAQVLDLIFLDSMTTNVHLDQFSGRGVGLAAVRAETAKLGGTVAVRTRPGQGTEFVFTLPFQGEGQG
ncbi:Predicted ATPase [Paramagnetospirillum magneticum AMB-1]|uniref:histidine kinase n=1 Tax=Paramagnetospirillum magneticum (strain ATCC 700264 / AMB-1) TaxID=342108 RepID=Q2W7A5_PARM1|nr:Predicted ATPase [Paramagnetospirillum magneticum AMB-1]